MSNKRSISDYIFSPLVWLQIIILFVLMTLLALVLTPMGPLIGAWVANTFVKELKIEGVSGSVLTGIAVDKVSFDDGEVLTRLSDIDVDFAAPDFGQNLVNIERLTLSSLDIVLAKSDEARQRGEPVIIGDFGIAPVNLNVITGAVGQFNVIEEGETLFSLSELTLDNTQITNNQILLKDVTANMAMEPTPISISIESGSLDMLEPHALDLVADMTWQNPDMGDISAEIRGQGLLQAYELSVNGSIDNPSLGTQLLTAQASGDFDFIDFSQLDLTGDAGSVQATGELAWVPALSTDLAIDAKNLNAAQFVPEWPTDITSQLGLKVASVDGKLRGGLDISSLNGTVRGYPLTATGKASMLNDELLFDQLEIKSSKNIVKINGRGSEPFDLSWDVYAPELSSLSAGVSGRLSAKGTLTGNIKQPIVNGEVEATRLAFQGSALDSGKLDIKTVNSDFQLDGKLQGLTVNGERIRNATLSGRGNVESHQFELLANHSQAQVTSSVEGGWDGTAWQGVLNKASVANSTAGDWSLQKPAKIKVSAAGVETDELCMASSSGSACTNINYNDQDGFSTSGKLANTPLDILNPILPPELAINGLVAGDYNITINPDLKGQADLKFSAGSVDLKKDGKTQRFAYRSGSVIADIDGNDIKASTSLKLADNGSIDANAEIKLSPSDGKHFIQAEGEFTEIPLGLGQAFLPPEINVTGIANGAFDIIQNGDERTGKIALSSSDVDLLYKDKSAGNQRYRFNQVKLDALIDNDKVDADVDLSLRDGGKLSTVATIDLSQPDIINGITAQGKVEAMPLALARPYLPNEFDVDGLVSGDYRLTQSANGPVGQVDLQASNGFFTYQMEGVERQRYRYNKVQLKGTLQDDQVIADVGLELQGGAVLTSKASVELASLSSGKPKFTAEGKISEIPLEMAQAFLPKGLVVKGNINGTYQLQQQTQLQGKVAFDFGQGSVSYDDGVTGAQLYQFNTAKVVADISGDNVVADLDLSLRDGGTFSTKGRLNLAKPDSLYDFEGEGQLTAFPLSLVQPYLPSTVKLTGSAEGSYQLTQKGGQQGRVTLKLPAGSVSILDEKGQAQTIAYELAELNATIRGKNIVADTRIQLSQGGVIDGKGTVVLGANANSHRIDIEGQLTSVPLSTAKPYIPEDIELPGNLNGSYRLSQRNGKRSGNLKLALPNSYFAIATASGEKQSFPYQDGIVNVTLDDNRINVDSSLDFQGRGTLRARAQVMLRDKGSPTINGNIDVNVPNVYWAQKYVPYSRGLRGQVAGKVAISGVVDQPKITGQIAFTDGYLRLPQVGTELTDINLRIQADQSNQARIVGTINSGGGILTAKGSLSLQDIKSWSARMSLKGSNIKFVDTNEAEAYMTPNLEIIANSTAVKINGTVDIPKASINLKDVPELSIGESEDVMVIGEQEAGEEVQSVRLQPNVLVRLGNNVFFKGFGFSTQLVGGIRVTNSRNTIVTNGTMRIVNGRYQAYGQDLKIDNGRLVFNGPPKNIGVDVQAVREIADGEVGIQLSGTLQKLKSTIYSDPVLDETDALSYLLTGNSLSSATGRETALLMQAVRGLGIDGSDGLIQRLGNSLGLDDLSIVTRDDFRESELQLGKRLGSNLYVKYLVGIFDSAHRVAIDYKINKYLNLEVQAGEEQSVDLIYEFERN